MSQYLLREWVFVFCFYSVVGYIWETVYCSLKEGKLLNRGFMKGPFLPIYGFGVCIMMIAAGPFNGKNILAECISGMVCATVLEYVTGELMQHLFKVRYWDYSKEKFNLNGHICLGASLGWFVATFVVNEIFRGPVDTLVHSISAFHMYLIDYIVMGIAILDFAISFKAAMDLRIILVKMEDARHELKLMQKRLDVLVAVVSDETKQAYKEVTGSISDMYDDFTDSVGEKFDHFEESIGKRLDYLKDNAKALGDKMIPDSGKKIVDEIFSMTDRYTAAIKKYTSFEHLKSKIKKLYIISIIRSNPSMTSDEYKEALEELKSSHK
ncbi:MAG: putative ABC transporter permease [Lachnospiraceae bacterium]|nr:putative ABC transporter permease [Lachnospiraceae bacterium]